MSVNIAIHGSHNANVAVSKDKELICVIELERFVNSKNIGFTSFFPIGNVQNYIIYDIQRYIEKHFGIKEYDCVYHQDTAFESIRDLRTKKFEELNTRCRHHDFHAYGTFYQSDLKEALVLSYDGGSNDGYFKIYKLKRNEPVEKLLTFDIDLGSHYGHFGELMADIKPSKFGNLTYAGKIMGLQSYGKVRDEWKPAVSNHYQYMPWWKNKEERLKTLAEATGLGFSLTNRLKNQDAWDLAATSQAVFEDIVFAMLDHIVPQHPDLPICLTGGCALNILANTKIKERYNRHVFVAPNSSDCGLAVGILADICKPEKPWDVTYAGLPALDQDLLMRYVYENAGLPADITKMTNDLANNFILGLFQGRSEHGPRALGNRSIICSPIGKNVKDILNAKVKNREWYRPFAPVVRLEDVNEYFEWNEESRWMNFCPLVKERYRELIPAIVHVDNTARVQTITREQNPLVYDLITEFKKKTGVGVLLNTSFNVDGKPILSTYADALFVFRNTRLDKLYLDGFYFQK
jgi:carbamoyltransferase